MIKAGLTGGIGSGKSTVAGLFVVLGVPVFYADNEARALYMRKDVISKVEEILDADLKHQDGSVDFKKIASIIFSDPVKLNAINLLLHPLVKAEFDSWCRDLAYSRVVILESAILYETGYDSVLDCIISVSAPEKLCIERVMKRDTITENEVRKRMANQMRPSLKDKRAQFCIINDEKRMLIPQVINILNQLTTKATDSVD